MGRFWMVLFEFVARAVNALARRGFSAPALPARKQLPSDPSSPARPQMQNGRGEEGSAGPPGDWQARLGDSGPPPHWLALFEDPAARPQWFEYSEEDGATQIIGEQPSAQAESFTTGGVDEAGSAAEANALPTSEAPPARAARPTANPPAGQRLPAKGMLLKPPGRVFGIQPPETPAPLADETSETLSPVSPEPALVEASTEPEALQAAARPAPATPRPVRLPSPASLFQRFLKPLSAPRPPAEKPGQAAAEAGEHPDRALETAQSAAEQPRLEAKKSTPAVEKPRLLHAAVDKVDRLIPSGARETQAAPVEHPAAPAVRLLFPGRFRAKTGPARPETPILPARPASETHNAAAPDPRKTPAPASASGGKALPVMNPQRNVPEILPARLRQPLVHAPPSDAQPPSDPWTGRPTPARPAPGRPLYRFAELFPRQAVEDRREDRQNAPKAAVNSPISPDRAQAAHLPALEAPTFSVQAGLISALWPDLPDYLLDEEPGWEEAARALERLRRLDQEQRGL
jgi:hypothetical protein